jgi:hypothetical protein
MCARSARWLCTPEVLRWWGNPKEQIDLITEDLDEPLDAAMGERSCIWLARSFSPKARPLLPLIRTGKPPKFNELLIWCGTSFSFAVRAERASHPLVVARSRLTMRREGRQVDRLCHGGVAGVVRMEIIPGQLGQRAVG